MGFKKSQKKVHYTYSLKIGTDSQENSGRAQGHRAKKTQYIYSLNICAHQQEKQGRAQGQKTSHMS